MLIGNSRPVDKLRTACSTRGNIGSIEPAWSTSGSNVNSWVVFEDALFMFQTCRPVNGCNDFVKEDFALSKNTSFEKIEGEGKGSR